MEERRHFICINAEMSGLINACFFFFFYLSICMYFTYYKNDSLDCVFFVSQAVFQHHSIIMEHPMLNGQSEPASWLL